jgi:cyanophycinase
VSRSDGAGPVALVGSGEFLEVMVPVDAELLAGRPQRAVFLPTASAEEGPQRVRYWIDLATAHYASMGVEPVPLEVLDREDAERPELASKVAGAGLVYLSGGNPGYLANTLAGTAVWQAILEAWRSGAAIAGCSAGACALSRVADDFREPGRYSGEALAVVPYLVVLPHFDRFEHWMPGLADRMMARTPAGRGAGRHRRGDGARRHRRQVHCPRQEVGVADRPRRDSSAVQAWRATETGRDDASVGSAI